MSHRLPSSVSRLPALARLESLSLRGMKLGLAAIDALCERLGRPERKVPSVLVGGTNGKGSTAATLSAIATACGLRAGLYTSPHLIRVNERVRLEGEDAASEELDAALGRVFSAADAAPPVPATYFEAMTAAAFLMFAGRGLDLAVLEVGLGGRLDATNVAPAVLSIVTSIGLDHTEELGATLPLIAAEKAGIFRRGRPALALAAAPEARDVLRAAAGKTEAQWHDASLELSVRVGDTGVSGTRFDLTTPLRKIALATPLPGAHQAWNAALAVRAAELLPESAAALTEAALAEGLRRVRWPGRLERLAVGGRDVLLDGCHNVDGAAALAAFLGEAGLAGRCRLIFGAMGDKDVEGIARLLFPAVRDVTLTAAALPRAAPAEDLARRVRPSSGTVSSSRGVGEAIEELLAQGGSAPIIVAGSLYLVGEARAWLMARGGKQMQTQGPGR